jgi:hypothetical protein
LTAARRVVRPEAPPPFRVGRDLPPGNYPLLTAFPGFTEVPPFKDYPVAARRRNSVAKRTTVQVVAERAWMYVAPHEVPPWATKYGWNPFSTATDCIVVGWNHLSRSPSITLYLDILHEFFHILQRDTGRELWDITKGYVDSPTELEAYRFSVVEARRLGVSDPFLRNYLKVEWVNAKDHRKLLSNLGVKPSGR